MGGLVLLSSTDPSVLFFVFSLLCRYISTYLSVQERDPKAHRFLGQIYEAQDNIEKAFGCYKVSTSLTSLMSCFIPSEMDLIFVLPALIFFPLDEESVTPVEFCSRDYGNSSNAAATERLD